MSCSLSKLSVNILIQVVQFIGNSRVIARFDTAITNHELRETFLIALRSKQVSCKFIERYQDHRRTFGWPKFYKWMSKRGVHYGALELVGILRRYVGNAVLKDIAAAMTPESLSILNELSFQNDCNVPNALIKLLVDSCEHTSTLKYCYGGSSMDATLPLFLEKAHKLRNLQVLAEGTRKTPLQLGIVLNKCSSVVKMRLNAERFIATPNTIIRPIPSLLELEIIPLLYGPGVSNDESIDDFARFTDAGMHQVAAAAPNLEVLTLHNCEGLTNEAFTYLSRGCPKLTCLKIVLSDTNGVSFDYNIALGKMTNLKEFDLSSTSPRFDLVDLSLEKYFVHSGAQLQTIRLQRENGIARSIVLSILQHCSSLETLHIDQSSFTEHDEDAGPDVVTANLIHLRELTIPYCCTFKQLSDISNNLPALVHLSMCSFVDIRCVDVVRLLTNCSQLVHLEIHTQSEKLAAIGDTDAETAVAIAAMPVTKLTYLRLQLDQNTVLLSEALFRNCPNLRELYFNCNASTGLFGASAVQHLLACHQLNVLHVSRVKNLKKKNLLDIFGAFPKLKRLELEVLKTATAASKNAVDDWYARPEGCVFIKSFIIST